MATALPEIICRVRAIYPFQSNERASLSFQPGDEIDVLTQLDSGWWDGWCNGMRGWFPCNYVEVIQDGVIDQQYGDNIVPQDDEEFIDNAMFIHLQQKQQKQQTQQAQQAQQAQQIQQTQTQPQRPPRQRRHNTTHSISSSNSSSTNSSAHHTSSQQQRRPKQPPRQNQTNGMDHRLSFLAYPQQHSQQDDWPISRTPVSPPMNYHDQQFQHRQFSQNDDDDNDDDLRSDTSLEMQLPEGWTLMMADDGKTSYYYNHLTGGMRFKHPGLMDSDGEYDSGAEDIGDHSILGGGSTGIAGSIRLGESSSSRPSTHIFEERKIITADALKRLSMASSDNEDAVTRQLQLQPHYAYPVTPQEPTTIDDDDNIEKMMESWVQRETPQGRPYFCNLITQETTWNYDDIDPTTGHLRSAQDDNSSQDSDQHDPETPTQHTHSSGDGIGNDKLGNDNHTSIEPQITWSTLSSDIALAIHQLNTVAQQGQRQKLIPHTSPVVESIRVMLYASGSMEKDVSQTQDPALREPRRAVMASLSKLVLSTKMASEATSNGGISSTTSPASPSSATPESVIKVQRDAGDVLSAVRNFVTTCQQCQVQVAHVDPRLIDTPDHIVGHPAGGNHNMSNKTMIAAMKKLQQEESHHPAITTTTSTSTPTASKTPSGTTTPAAMKLSDSGVNMVQKAKYPLNQDLVVSLRTHGNQIYGSTDALSTSISFLLTLHRMDGSKSKGRNHRQLHHDDDDDDGIDNHISQKSTQRHQYPLYEDSVEEENGKANVVHLFRSLSAHLSQFLSILEDIDVPAIADVDNELPSLRSYRADKQILYNGVGQLFGTVQQLTDQMNERSQAVEAIDQAITRVERAMEGILTDVGEMVLQRHAWMVRQEDKNNNNTTATAAATFVEGGGDLSLSPTTPHFYDAPEDHDDDFIVNNNPPPTPFDDARRRGTMASLRKRGKPSIDDSKTCANWFLSPDYRPNELLFGNDNNVKGGTLAALVERLTMHDSFDTSYIATFLLTYRSFCTTEEFINLLQDRYNMQAPDDLTPEQLEVWTETKQKLVRLRVFNVLKNWLENYYDEEDGFILGRLEFFTNTVVRDASPFSADQLNRLIRKRKEAGSNQSGLKKLVPQVFDGPLPIMPKNISHIRLLETDPLEMARQLSLCDFKLYSGIRPIECLNKAWSRDTVKGGVPVAANVIQSIDYCNRLTSWVTDSILSYDEAKKRVVIIKYWAQVAEKCRNMNNYNTCMAVISAFDNSAIGRLKKTWELLGNRTSQALSQIRKLMGANRNFTEYREMVHSVNPPCIPFLGIYLQDLTFIEDGNPDYLKKSEGLINFAKRQKCAEVIQEIKQFQSPPYTFRLVPELQDFIKTHLETNRDVETLYERSLELEPRETPSSTIP